MANENVIRLGFTTLPFTSFRACLDAIRTWAVSEIWRLSDPIAKESAAEFEVQNRDLAILRVIDRNNPTVLNTPPTYRITPSTIAIPQRGCDLELGQEREFDIVDRLLEYGFDKNAKNIWGVTFLAVENGWSDMVELFLRRNCEKSKGSGPNDATYCYNHW